MDIDLDAVRNTRPLEELLQFCVLNVDKPSGPTSFRTADTVRRHIGARKAGHFGTLDPNATGVLPVALNRACRLANWFMGRDKTYVATMRLHADVPRPELEEHMHEFVGRITQLPPVRSRVKRQERERTVHRFEITEMQGREAVCVVECEAGTYVRKLIHDVGEQIGGAHMSALRRTRASVFGDGDKTFATLEQVREAAEAHRDGDESKLRRLVTPGEVIGCILPTVQARQDAVDRLLHGYPVEAADLDAGSELPDEGEAVAVFRGERLLEVARVVREGDVVARPEFVLI